MASVSVCSASSERSERSVVSGSIKESDLSSTPEIYYRKTNYGLGRVGRGLRSERERSPVSLRPLNTHVYTYGRGAATHERYPPPPLPLPRLPHLCD